MKPSQALIPRLGAAAIRPAPISIPTYLVHPIQATTTTTVLPTFSGSHPTGTGNASGDSYNVSAGVNAGAAGWEGWWYSSKSVESSGATSTTVDSLNKTPVAPISHTPIPDIAHSQFSANGVYSNQPTSTPSSHRQHTKGRDESTVPAPTLAWCDFLSMV